MIQYTLSFAQYYQHIIDVKIRFTASKLQTLWLPTWIPGSYLIREFSKHIEAFRAIDVNTQQAIIVHKINKNQWQLNNTHAIEVEVSYQVYAYDLSVRGAYVDHERLYVNPAVACMAVTQQEEKPIAITLVIPEEIRHFQLASSFELDHSSNEEIATFQTYHFKVIDYSTLIDSPFELAVQHQISFDVGHIPHRLAISGQHQANLQRLSSDLKRICQTEIALFGEAPFNNYLFMVMATANSYGGLEHQTSTSLISPRDDLPKLNEPIKPSTNYQRFLGLCSHEYFHAWLVKCIRPHNFVAPNLHQEAYTPLLWIFEGFTSYYDDLILYRSGVIDKSAYLGLLGEQITRYLQNPGRAVQSVAESSFDAWIKYYRPDENSNNAGTSYYNKGALVALCLDLTLRKHGSSLDEVLRSLYQRAKNGVQVDEQTIASIAEQLTGQSLHAFLTQYVEGTSELPLAALLAEFGVALSFDKKVWPLGLKAQETAQGLQVQQVLRDSAAARAGLSAHDVIIALNQLKATSALLVQTTDIKAEMKQAVECYAFRRDELKKFTIALEASDMPSAQLTIKDSGLLQAWLAEIEQNANEKSN